MFYKFIKEFDYLIDLNDVIVVDIIFICFRFFVDDYLIIYKVFYII